ncbi:MAG: hypothetical protein MIO90_03530 [Methanomassiliicoccales archaeon]|nr:hypothetical protein [Methanomassiliicoccales archaeon]
MVATIIVAACGASLVIGGENEPSPPHLPTQYRLSYEVVGQGAMVHFNGSFSMDQHRHWITDIPYDTTGDLGPDLEGLPSGVMHTFGHYFDTIKLKTVWGNKTVNRIVSPLGIGDRIGMCIEYRGADTFLPYRMELTMPEYRANYTLKSVNCTEILDVDETSTKDHYDLGIYGPISQGFYGWDSSGTSWQVERPEIGNYSIHVETTNMSVTFFAPQQIQGVIAGGPLAYDHVLSFNGTGSRNFILTQDYLYLYFHPSNDGSMSYSHGIVFLD